MLDSGGHPLTTSSNALRDIVLPPSLLNKLLNVAGANFTKVINSGLGPGAAGGAFSSPIPWRKAGLRYTSNEIYFDVVEELRAIVNKYVYVISFRLSPRFHCDCFLVEMGLQYLILFSAKSRRTPNYQVRMRRNYVPCFSFTSEPGTPDCLLLFTNPNGLKDCAFHPCVRCVHLLKKRSVVSYLRTVCNDGHRTKRCLLYLQMESSFSRNIAIHQVHPVHLYHQLQVSVTPLGNTSRYHSL